MSTSILEERQILEALRRVPSDRWPDVLRYITSLLGTARGEAGAPPICTAADLANSDLVGLWADRTDIIDGQTFARQLRQQAEQRRGASHAP